MGISAGEKGGEADQSVQRPGGMWGADRGGLVDQ